MSDVEAKTLEAAAAKGASKKLQARLAGAEAVGEHKTSMLQDIEAKRPTEVAALVGSIIELGELVEVPTPAICAVYACVRLLEDTLAQAP